jgi:hypothetical protein
MSGYQGFTVYQLIARLEKLKSAGHGRKRVCVDRYSFENSLDAPIMNVHGIGVQCVPVMDDDGGTKYNARGEECTAHLVVLVGSRSANCKGEIVE